MVCLQNIASSQIVQSSCEAPDSIIQLYRDDADALTLERFYLNNYSYADSIHIPTIYSDTTLDALIAVYNATSIPERDSIVNLYNIHVDASVSIKSFSLVADSNLNWMKKL